VVILTLMASSGDPKEQHDKELLQEIKQLRAELKAFKATPNAEPPNEAVQLSVWIESIPGDRKPFLVRCRGLGVLELRVSPMRAAILIGLFLDLEGRVSGNSAKSDLVRLVGELYQTLIGKTIQDKECSELVRVGFYRFETSIGQKALLEDSGFKLSYSERAKHLELIYNGESLPVKGKIQLALSTPDQRLLSLIDSKLASSPLARIRSQGSMYISSSELGWDRLFLEYFKHDLPVKNSSLFYRPGIVTFPDELLSFLKASKHSIERRELTLKGYKEDRIQFNEFLSRQSLYDMIHNDSRASGKIYGRQIPNALARTHVKEIIRQLQSFPGYNLTLTSATFPFIVGVVEIGDQSSTDLEMFSMFYRLPSPADAQELTCFVLHNKSVAAGILGAVIPSVSAHPSTVSDRKKVIEELQCLLETPTPEITEYEE
jgi:hypothetical protein